MEFHVNVAAAAALGALLALSTAVVDGRDTECRTVEASRHSQPTPLFVLVPTMSAVLTAASVLGAG